MVGRTPIALSDIHLTLATSDPLTTDCPSRDATYLVKRMTCFGFPGTHIQRQAANREVYSELSEIPSQEHFAAPQNKPQGLLGSCAVPLPPPTATVCAACVGAFALVGTGAANLAMGCFKYL